MSDIVISHSRRYGAAKILSFVKKAADASLIGSYYPYSISGRIFSAAHTFIYCDGMCSGCDTVNEFCRLTFSLFRLSCILHALGDDHAVLCDGDWVSVILLVFSTRHNVGQSFDYPVHNVDIILHGKERDILCR